MNHVTSTTNCAGLLAVNGAIDRCARRRYSLPAAVAGRAAYLEQAGLAAAGPVEPALAAARSMGRGRDGRRAPRLVAMIVFLLVLAVLVTGMHCAAGAWHVTGLRGPRRLAEQVRKDGVELRELKEKNQALLCLNAKLAAQEAQMAMQAERAGRAPQLAAATGQRARAARVARGTAPRARVAPATAPRGGVARGLQVAAGTARGAQPGPPAALLAKGPAHRAMAPG